MAIDEVFVADDHIVALRAHAVGPVIVVSLIVLRATP